MVDTDFINNQGYVAQFLDVWVMKEFDIKNQRISLLLWVLQL